MKMPTITHLQALIMSILLAGELSGSDLRAALRKAGSTKIGPLFYGVMARLERDKLVKVRYVRGNVDGQIVRERHYKVTGFGSRSLKLACEFYAEKERSRG